MIAPARRAAYEVVRRVFEEEAYADRALASAVAGLDAARPGARAAARLRHGAAARTIDYGIEQLGKRPVRKLDPPVLAALRLGAYELALHRPGRSTRSSTTRSSSSARRGLERAGRSRTRSCAGSREGFQGLVASLPEGPLKHSYPDWIAETWVRDFGREEALELMRAQNEPAGLVVRSAEPVGEPTDVPGAYLVEHGRPARACGR